MVFFRNNSEKKIFQIIQILMISFFFCAGPAFSNELESGVEIKAEASVNFREGIKIGFWKDPKILQVVKPGEQLILLKKEELKIPFVKNRIWLNVKDPESGNVGWVYNGVEGGEGYFSVLKEDVKEGKDDYRK